MATTSHSYLVRTLAGIAASHDAAAAEADRRAADFRLKAETEDKQAAVERMMADELRDAVAVDGTTGIVLAYTVAQLRVLGHELLSNLRGPHEGEGEAKV